MLWYPLRLGTTSREHALGGRAIADVLGRSGLPDGPVVECFEVDDGAATLVTEGPLRGATLRTLTEEHPDELVGPGWTGDRFPFLASFVDGSCALPVHVHTGDEGPGEGRAAPEDTAATADATATWHVLAAASGATAWCGTLDGVGADELRTALLDRRLHDVLHRLPVSAGDTLAVPGGTPHSFGPGTLLYEIELVTATRRCSVALDPPDTDTSDDTGTTDEGASADVENATARRVADVDALVRATRFDTRPTVRAAAVAADEDGVRRLVCSAGPGVGLQRWRSAGPVTVLRRFASVQVLSNLGDPVRVRTSSWDGVLGRARSLVLPAALGRVHLQGTLDLLIGHLPDGTA